MFHLQAKERIPANRHTNSQNFATANTSVRKILPIRIFSLLGSLTSRPASHHAPTQLPNFRFRTYYRGNPPYAILSHTWEDEKVLFQDFKDNIAKGKAGYKKITACCAQAMRDGFLPCMDPYKLYRQDSINSMFRWYQRSAMSVQSWHLFYVAAVVLSPCD
jgi:hypothetical protein